ncbi:unnamed protein product [Rhizoctonia solani]|uniref:Mixed lineage kinase domain-containing protein n=1 Tax=Rhizoctonia solani TaxID=456999 RepID=A0A8H3CBJ9_9AGAM|nr:unnamed protein product [Rhizoctonia solani]
MSGAVLGTAFGAMQIIYAAYRDVKSNRENCATLVHRAEIVVGELKSLVVRQMQDEEVIAEKIENLLSAFETTAQVIRQIGHKNWLRALLDADRDAIQVEHCHQCLTDLMFLFNIEQNFDQWNLQRENELARKRDHHNLLRVTHSVQSELATQGEIIGEVLEMVRTLSQSPTFNAPARGASQDSRVNCTYHSVVLLLTAVANAPRDNSEPLRLLHWQSHSPVHRKPNPAQGPIRARHAVQNISSI